MTAVEQEIVSMLKDIKDLLIVLSGNAIGNAPAAQVKKNKKRQLKQEELRQYSIKQLVEALGPNILQFIK
jgi:hypothetical protein